MHRIDVVARHLQDNAYVWSERVGDVTVLRMRAVATARDGVLCRAMRMHLLRALRAAEVDAACRVVVLASARRDIFSLGVVRDDFADALAHDGNSSINNNKDNNNDVDDVAPSAATLFDAVARSRKRVVAVLDGACVSWGVELALAAHCRVAAPTAYMAFADVQLGLVPCGGADSLRRLVRAVGIRHAVELLLLRPLRAQHAQLQRATSSHDGRPRPWSWWLQQQQQRCTAVEARRIGLVDAIAPPSLSWCDLVAFAARQARQHDSNNNNNNNNNDSTSSLQWWCLPWQLVYLSWVESTLRTHLAPRDLHAPLYLLDTLRAALTRHRTAPTTRLGDERSNSNNDGDDSTTAMQPYATSLRSPHAYAAQHLLRAMCRHDIGSCDSDDDDDKATTAPPPLLVVLVGSAASTSLVSMSTMLLLLQSQQRQQDVHARHHTNNNNNDLDAVAACDAAAAVRIVVLNDGNNKGGDSSSIAAATPAAATTSVAQHVHDGRRCHGAVTVVQDVRDVAAQLCAHTQYARDTPHATCAAVAVLECAATSPSTRQALLAHLQHAHDCAAVYLIADAAAAVATTVTAAKRHHAHHVLLAGLHLTAAPLHDNPFVEVTTLSAPHDDVSSSSSSSSATMAVLRRVLRLLGKRVVLHCARGCSAATWLLHCALHQVHALLEDGCYPYEVDCALRRRGGFAYGLLELDDYIGLDTFARVRDAYAHVAATSTSTTNETTTAVLRQLVRDRLPRRDVYAVRDALRRDGCDGRATRRGWYVYKDSTTTTTPASAVRTTPPCDNVATTMAAAAACRVLAWPHGCWAATLWPATPLLQQPPLPPPLATSSFALTLPQPDGDVEARLRASCAHKRRMRRDCSDVEVCERVVLTLANEAAALLDAGVLPSASAVDCLSMCALGFAAPHDSSRSSSSNNNKNNSSSSTSGGGLCAYVDAHYGIDGLVQRIRLYHTALGSDTFAPPCDALLRMQRRGVGFAAAFPDRSVM